MKDYVVAFDLGGHHLRGALLDGSLKIIRRKELATASSRNINDVMLQVKAIYTDLVQDKHNVPVSMGVPGYIRKNFSIAHLPNFSNWLNVNMRKKLADTLNIDESLCHALNDANAALLAETVSGYAQAYKHVIFIGIGTGVGGAALVNGQLLEGQDGLAGEFGHVSINEEGPICGCGNRGCIEQYISATAFKKRYQQSPKEVADKARTGDKASCVIYETLGKNLASAMASMVYVFNPQLLVLGGRVSRSLDLFEDSLKQELKQRLKHHPAMEIKIVAAKHGDDAGIIGAATYYFQQKR